MLTPNGKTWDVMQLMKHGFAPSSIDRILGLKDGESKRLVVAHWSRDRRAGK